MDERILKNSEILIIDDEEEIRTLLKRVFESRGSKVSLASNGEEGFDILMNSHCDLVIADLYMPEMDGFELISAIRQVDPHIPIIVVTGYATEENINRFFSVGATDYFAKPFDINQIIQRTSRILLDKTETNNLS